VVTSGDKEFFIEDKPGGFAVYPRERTVTVTTLKDGKLTREVKPIEAVIPGGSRLSVFTAWWQNGGPWDTDEFRGAMRQTTTRTSREIRAALEKLGFSRPDIALTIRTARGLHKKE